MENVDLVRLLNSVGKRVFVEYFHVFADRNLTTEEKISKLPKEYKLTGSRTRVSCAKRIFDAKMQKQALQIVAESKAEKDSREKARNLLRNLA